MSILYNFYIKIQEKIFPINNKIVPNKRKIFAFPVDNLPSVGIE